MIPQLSLAWWLVVSAVILIAWIFEASFRVSHELRARITELEKVDREDLQNMLGGMFLGNTFMYPAETLIKKYEGRFQIEQLKSGFDIVRVRAPKNSVIELSFHFFNRQVDHNYQFHLLDANNQDIPIDIFSGRISVLLDGRATFGLKLVMDNAFEVAQTASLQVCVLTWTK